MELSRKKPNPSSWGQRILLSCIAALAGMIAAYMGLYQWGLISHVWDPVFGRGTELVLTSNVSHLLKEWIRIPDAVLGAVSYLGDVMLGLAGSSSRWKDRPWLVLFFGLYVIPPATVSMMLVATQGLILKSWCFLCLVSAATSLLLILLSYKEVWTTIVYLRQIWRQTKDKRFLWRTLWGKGSLRAYQIAKEMEE